MKGAEIRVAAAVNQLVDIGVDRSVGRKRALIISFPGFRVRTENFLSIVSPLSEFRGRRLRYAHDSVKDQMAASIWAPPPSSSSLAAGPSLSFAAWTCASASSSE